MAVTYQFKKQKMPSSNKSQNQSVAATTAVVTPRPQKKRATTHQKQVTTYLQGLKKLGFEPCPGCYQPKRTDRVCTNCPSNQQPVPKTKTPKRIVQRPHNLECIHCQTTKSKGVMVVTCTKCKHHACKECIEVLEEPHVVRGKWTCSFCSIPKQCAHDNEVVDLGHKKRQRCEFCNGMTHEQCIDCQTPLCMDCWDSGTSASEEGCWHPDKVRPIKGLRAKNCSFCGHRTTDRCLECEEAVCTSCWESN